MEIQRRGGDSGVGTTPARRPGRVVRRELGPELAATTQLRGEGQGRGGGRAEEGIGAGEEPEAEESCTYQKFFKQLISGRLPKCQALLRPLLNHTTARSSRLNSAASPEPGRQLFCDSCCSPIRAC